MKNKRLCCILPYQFSDNYLNVYITRSEFLEHLHLYKIGFPDK